MAACTILKAMAAPDPSPSLIFRFKRGSLLIFWHNFAWAFSADRCPTMQWSNKLILFSSPNLWAMLAAAQQTYPSRITGICPIRAAMMAPNIAAISKPPTCCKLVRAEVILALWSLTDFSTILILFCKASPSTPVPAPTHIFAVSPNRAWLIAAAVVVLPIPISPRQRMSIFSSTHVMP